MAYHLTSNVAGVQAVADNSTVKNHALGTIMTGEDPDLGGGEFIYLQGIGSTILGSVVEYNSATYITGLASIGLTLSNPLAVAMAATVASEFGWYQISGNAAMGKASALSHAADLGVGATTGLVVAADTGLIMHGAITAQIGTATVATCQVMINRPTGPGDQS